MAKKPDFSRLVMLDLTPSEAVVVAKLCSVCLAEANKYPPADFDDMRETLGNLIGRINLQLDQLHWPRERRQAPYPV